MDKKNSLTSHEEELLEEWRLKYLGYGLSCERADRPRAEAAIGKLYQNINKPIPQFWWFDSPLSCELFANLRGNLRDNLGANLWNNLWDNLGANLRNNLWNNLGANLRDNLWDNLGANLQDNLWNNLGANLRDNLGANQLQRHDNFWGQHNLAWIAFYRFMPQIGIKYFCKDTSLLECWNDIGESCCCWWPFENMCIISERPVEIHTEPSRRPKVLRLHNPDGPALKFADGYSLYMWHGTRVPEQVILRPETLTVKEALVEQNTEVRRIMLTRIGAEKLEQELPSTIIDTDIDGKGQCRRLFQLSGITDRRFVAYTCPSTGREYPAQPVPPEVRTCTEAVAWRFGALDIEGGRTTKRFDYAPAIEG